MLDFVLSYIVPIFSFWVLVGSIIYGFNFVTSGLKNNKRLDACRPVHGIPEDGQTEHIRKIAMLKSRGNYNLQTGHYITTSDLADLRKRVYK